MARLVAILLVGLLMEAAGVVFLSKGLKQIGDLPEVSAAAVWGMFKKGATNPALLLGVGLEAVFFGTLLYLMSKSDVSFIWPLTALGFVLTTLAARLILKEEVSGLRWAGVFLIVCGAGLITYTEKLKEARKQAAAEAISAPASSSQPGK